MVFERSEVGGKYTTLRLVADLLTMLRFLTAAFVVILGFAAGPRGFAAAVIATIFGWATDCADGPIARASGGRESWVGRLDFAADMCLSFSFFLYAVAAGLYPIIPALCVMGAACLIILIRPTEQVMEMVSAPFTGLPIVLSFHAGLAVGVCYVLFVVSMAVLRWDKLSANARGARAEAEGLRHG